MPEADWPICKCGCGLPTGGGFRINFQRGSATSVGPSSEVAELKCKVEELEHEVKLWKFNAEGWERQNAETTKNMRRHHADDRARLARVWALVSRRRKTVRMDDLREALQGYLSADDDAA